MSLVTRLEDTPWTAEGACRGAETAVFFPKLPGGPRHHDRADHAEALAYCARCPVVVACREYAVRTYQPGVWGDTTPAERRKIRANMRRRASA